jgi:hypothetical protein
MKQKFYDRKDSVKNPFYLFLRYINQPSQTSFGECKYLPLWKSVLTDYAYILGWAIYFPILIPVRIAYYRKGDVNEKR